MHPVCRRWARTYGAIQRLRIGRILLGHAVCGSQNRDATTLNDGQLVPRQSGNGWALRVFQQKTEDWVYVPIPDFVEAELRRLKFKGKKDGCNYWFWTCKGELDTATTNWRERISSYWPWLRSKSSSRISQRHILSAILSQFDT